MKTLKTTLIIPAMFAMFALSAQNGYEVGDVVNGFSLKNTVTGKMVSLSDYSDAKGFIVTFTCNHCPYAKANEDRIIALDKKYDPMGYPVIAISPNDPERVPEDSPENLKKRAQERNYPFPYLFDATQEVTRQFGAKKTPHIFILTKTGNGNYKVRYIGAVDDSPMNPDGVKATYVEDAIAAIENGNEPKPDKTYAVGCTIKWKQ